MSKVLEGLKKDILVHISAYNKLIVTKGDFATMARLENEIREAEAVYAEQQMREVFVECKKASDPILAAVERYTYPILAHRLNREEGVVTEMVLVEDRTKQIDLVKLCKVLGLSHLWEYKVEEFGNLLCMRTAKDLGWSDKQIERISRLYYRNALCQKQEVGAIPTSNNQIVKLLQSIMDMLLPADPETGKAKYHCNSRDVAYILKVYTKRSNKKELTVDVAKNSFVHRLIMDVMHRVVTGKLYDLNYQMRKEEPAVSNERLMASNSDTVLIPRPIAEKAEMEELCNLDDADIA